MTAAPASQTGAVSRQELERLYSEMARIRHFEDMAERLFMQNEMTGSIHLSQGQEAIPVGVCTALEEGDVIAATYRGHGACLAKGSDMTGLFAELLGRDTGTCGGRAGSMNIVDLEAGVIGCFSIVGGSIAAATGAALAAQVKKTGSVDRRVLRRRSGQPGVLPRVPQLRGGRTCLSSTCARTTSTASSHRWAAVTAGAGSRPVRPRTGSPPPTSTGTTSWQSSPRPQKQSGARARVRADAR